LNEPDNVTYEFGPFLLEPHARRLSRDGESVPLAAAEFELLLLLVRNRGRVVEKKEIMASVWMDVEVEENNLTVRMSSLRRALGETKGNHPYIQTVTGRGYCLIAPVKESQPQAESIAESNSRELSAAVAPQQVEHSLPTAGRKWKIHGFKLYALVVLALLVASSLVYAVVRWQRKGRSQTALQSMKMSRVTQSGRVWQAALSPDGQTIAYVERDSESQSLWLQRAGTTNPLQLQPPAKVSYWNPVFTPDGNTLYYSKCEPDCELHRMPVLGGVETSLGTRADSRVTFSPDGKRIAYMRTDAVESGIAVNLMIANANGTDIRAINSRSDGLANQGGSPAWSPDGKIIVMPFLVGEGRDRGIKLFAYGVADGAESTLTSHTWRFVKDVCWLPDGSGLIINARDEVAAPEGIVQIFHVPLPDGEPRRITNDLNNYWRIGLSADGRTVMALQLEQTSSLWIGPTENPSAATRVTRGTMDRQDGSLGVALAPNGRLIYVAEISGKRDLWSINADGSGLKQLTDSHGDIFPAVTPDGRYIVFGSGREGVPGLWRIDADGRNPLRLTRSSISSRPICSPDGRWVFYSTRNDANTMELRKVSIDGGEPRKVTNEYAMYPAISPDGKMIAYYYMDTKGEQRRRNIKVIPAQGGATIKTLPAPPNFGQILRWAPDGNSLTYRENKSNGIWRLPLDGTPLTPIMTLSGQHFYDYSYSPDGRQLAYASGPDLSDVILIKQFN
jgi:Tol biopolymer transport system component/DNA-binding winged helix-turn-helix (wHTH) protein